jgi:hypothetical protein
MSAQPNFSFPHPLYHHTHEPPPGESPPRVWYMPDSGGRVYLLVVRAIPHLTGEPRWVCYGPAHVVIPEGLRVRCAPREARKQCVLMLLRCTNGTWVWMPQGRSLIERELLPQPQGGWDGYGR